MFMAALSVVSASSASVPASPYVQIENVCKSYSTSDAPVNALDGINLTIKHGEFVSIVGPSGCGKSTLLKCIAGLESISSGQVRVKGTQSNEPPDDMGVVFQRDVLLDWRTVLDNVLLMVEFRGLKRSDYQPRARDLLKKLGLDGFAGP